MLMPTLIRTSQVAETTEATEQDIDDCYRLLLGREPDEPGRATWIARLEAGGLELGDLVRKFVLTGEFQRGHGLEAVFLPEGPYAEDRRQNMAWKLARALISSSKDHAFLDRRWIGWILRMMPGRFREPLALRLLSLSPHYWVYQWTSRYPTDFRRGAILRREFDRNASSRREICENILRRFLRPEMTVLDFGCGPGFLAREVSRHVKQVVAADVSHGVTACARVLNAAPNLKYVTNRPANLAAVDDRSIDLVYSFAVFQHLLKEQTVVFFREFARVLRPGGSGLFHIILKNPHQQQYTGHTGETWLEKEVHLRMVYLSDEEIRGLLTEAGFRDIQIRQVSSIAKIRDDIGNEHLVTFRY
jgi:2-polyprenyl-3-methyl-5-hydroxy-6-metoxy-1,4-benzoquinol methylase